MDVASVDNMVYPSENRQAHMHTPAPHEPRSSVLPICDWATIVDFRSQSGENGSPNSASLSPCREEGSLVQTWSGEAKITSSLDTKPKATSFIF